MILTNNDAQIVYDFLESSRKIGQLAISLEQLRRMFHTINGINALDESTTIFNGNVLENIEIDSRFSQLIVPGKISFTGEHNQVDLRNQCYEHYDPTRAGFDADIRYMNPREFRNVWYGIVGSRKRDINLQSVASLKEIASLQNLSNRELRYVNGERRCHQSTGYYVPLRFCFQIAEQEQFNYNVDDMLEKWFETTLDNIK